MQKGIEPWILFASFSGIASQIIAFFAFYHWAKRFPITILLAFSLLSPIVGSIAWTYFNKLNGWSFYHGGPGNEPFGIYAAVWGAVTIFPVIFSVVIVNSTENINSISAVIRWFVSRECLLVLVCIVLAALISTLFYGFKTDIGVRSYISSWGLSYERTEQLMIVTWALSISFAPAIAISLFGGPYSPGNSNPQVLLYSFPFLVSTLLCVTALAVYFGLYDYTKLDPNEQIKGIIAGFILRFGLFWGTWLAIDTRNIDNIWKIVKNHADKPFS